jgi:hypothetical protein
MKPDQAIGRHRACCLILSAVLVMGIVQWSFLPILIQTAPFSGAAVSTVSNSHTSKFAAPFKCLLGDSLKPCLSGARVSVPRLVQAFLHQLEEPASDGNDRFFSYHQLRAPPSV